MTLWIFCFLAQRSGWSRCTECMRGMCNGGVSDLSVLADERPMQFSGIVGRIRERLGCECLCVSLSFVESSVFRDGRHFACA
ncbi:MAG: hypothetical protein P4L40_00020 [Terracidiphilus sp.]|nr:hypothetical protein [Terracidiphilus sp.]